MVEGGGLEIHCARSRTGGSNPPLSARRLDESSPTACAARPIGEVVARGEVTEWSKVHDRKSCVGQPTGGSNPPLSAIAIRFPDPSAR